MNYPKILDEISSKLSKVGAKAIIVGGSVRDHFMQKRVKDFDVEVYGVGDLDELKAILQRFGRVKEVGKSFGVLKFFQDGYEFDFSMPRREKKVSQGHRGFNVELDGTLSFKEAARRRDFTTNAMGYDISNGEFLDPFDGQKDLASKTLRVVDEKSFVEDPLRVYRGVQFCARFGFEMDFSTKDICKKVVESGILEELSKERIWEEFRKLLLKSDKPSVGFELMRELGVLRYYPELEALIGVEQEPKWHPEGDVWIHTMMSIDAMASLKTGESKRDLVLMLGTLCHDFGKPATTKFIDGAIRSRGHEEAGVEPTREFIKSLSDEVELIGKVLPLVAHHLKPSQLYNDKSSLSAVRRLATKVKIEDLVVVAKADFLGRTTEDAKDGNFEAGEWLLEKAKELNIHNQAPKPLIEGRDLIEMGYKPSKKFGLVLNEVYQKQLDSEVDSKEEALELAKKMIERLR